MAIIVGMRVPRILWIVGALAICVPILAGDSPFAACLPKDIKLSDRIDQKGAGNGTPHAKSVEEVLLQMKAHCADNKLLDEAGREIVLYRLAGCWGNPPADSQEILDDQRKEIEKLKEKFTVVEVICASDGSRYIQ